jgi:hypothetical protein
MGFFSIFVVVTKHLKHNTLLTSYSIIFNNVLMKTWNINHKNMHSFFSLWHIYICKVESVNWMFYPSWKYAISSISTTNHHSTLLLNTPITASTPTVNSTPLSNTNLFSDTVLHINRRLNTSYLRLWFVIIIHIYICKVESVNWMFYPSWKYTLWRKYVFSFFLVIKTFFFRSNPA